MASQSAKWQTVASWVKSLEAQIIEADAQMQVRQRLAWHDFRRSLAGGNVVQMAEGLDQAAHFGIDNVQLKAWLEPLPNSIGARVWRFLRRSVGLDEPPANSYRLGVVGSHAGPGAVEISIKVTRLDGRWDTTAETNNGASPEQMHVAGELT